ncbi:uncharacterized protein ARMOST_11541 [Armillaria ostoyae]|uniref:Uncharacterized protein n=1 Tax=Armillaria ostoyae TaxID=47428 RepID=A0A284RHF2_ARMOS|nr:uncharacterized protein ARMOST_11541 [Armillaria ostoyae]
MLLSRPPNQHGARFWLLPQHLSFILCYSELQPRAYTPCIVFWRPPMERRSRHVASRRAGTFSFDFRFSSRLIPLDPFHELSSPDIVPSPMTRIASA